MNARYLRRHELIIFYDELREWVQFVRRDFSSPSPTFVKMRTLTSFAIPNGNWVETGTYMGSTCSYLAKRYPKVTSIEPSNGFFAYSRSRLRKFNNIILLNGTSEELFAGAFASSGPVVNVWLDGHFSDGGTFEGSQVTPVMEELASVAKLKNEFKHIVLFIDDIRLFPKSEFDVVTGYPPLMSVVNWCSKNGFKWEIQNDILIARMVN